MSVPKIQSTYYPESDGRPMGETDEHRDAMIRVIELLMSHFQNQNVYVSGNLLVYYEQGNPKRFVVPDAFIAKGLKQKKRRIYRLWVEGVVPQLVIETTSLKTKKKDAVEKLELYARLGVHEYFLHDPTGEYLDPPLQGYRLSNGVYQAVVADAAGFLFSDELELLMKVVDGEFCLFQPQSLQQLLTYREHAEKESEARQVAEAEIQRLKAELEKYKGH